MRNEMNHTHTHNAAQRSSGPAGRTRRSKRVRAKRRLAEHARAERTNWLPWTALAALATLIWAYWPTLVPLWQDWQTDDNYSVGQLVPLAAAYLLWQDRASLRKCKIRPCWWGIGIILLAEVGRAFSLMLLYESAERYAFVLAVVGLVLLVFGWEVFFRLRWLLLFLFLMVPLPGRIHNLISTPLQSWATSGAVVLLELFGVTVMQDGNVIVLNQNTPLAVAEACSGLRMLTAFVVMAAVLAYLVRRPRWQKAVLVVSSVPVAIACNLMRLVVTAILFMVASGELAQRFFHDFAGISMMPAAIAILLFELWIMARLVLPDDATDGPAARTAG